MSSLTSCVPVRTNIRLGMSIDYFGVSGFYLSAGRYYGFPHREVLIIQKRHIPDDEIPVVLFLARSGAVATSMIVDLRLSGLSWMDISLRLGLAPDIFYVPLRVAPGPPYGKAYGYYKNKPRKQWKSIRLNDAEVAGFVNLRFMSEHHGISPDEVMKMRRPGRGFVGVNDRILKGKEKKKYKDKGPGRGKGRGR